MCQPSLETDLHNLKEQGAPLSIQSIYQASSTSIFSCKDHSSKTIYITNYFASRLGFKKAEHFLGLDDTYINAPIVECADFFMNEDKLVFSTNTHQITIGSFQYANECLHLIKFKSIIRDDRLHKDIEICRSCEINPIIIQLLNSLFNFNRESEKYYENNKVYYTSHPIKNYPLKTALTQQETVCLFHLLRGKTAVSIAKILNRSRRTIECHIDHIKIKFECRTKENLVEKAMTMGFSNIMPPIFLDHKTIL